MTTSNGINLEGFSNTGEQSGTNTIDGNYSPATGKAFPAADKSTQGAAGTTNKMVHTAAETSAFGTGK
jgi:hypothetical protein